MTLVDTSVWIDHFRRGNAELRALLEADEVLSHPFVTGELACGTLPNRGETLYFFSCLPAAVPADNAEVFHSLEMHRMWGKGVGWVDAHLVCSALLSKARFWTLDQRLAGVARGLGC